MRLKELFTQAARERDGAIQSRDEALRERDQLAEENQRLREMVQFSTSSTSGTDSGYDSLSVACDATRSSSLSNSDGFPSLTAAAPVQGNALSVWELSESRGFASDGIISQEPIVKVEPGVSSTRPVSDSAQVRLQQPSPPGMDYDELGLDFVLT